MNPPDFRAMTDTDLEQWILSFPDRFDIPGALFELQRRQSLHRYRQILRWTIIAAVAALIAALAALITLAINFLPLS
jgi:hypothetical protein